MEGLSVVEILRYGVIGLAFLLAFLAFRILMSEQRRELPRKVMLSAAYVFMLFSLMICVVITYKELRDSVAAANIESSLPVPYIGWRADSIENTLMIQCFADGDEIGERLPCQAYGTCDSVPGNRLICAGTYYSEAIARKRKAESAAKSRL